MPTALIVEDEPEANKLLGMLLRLRGYQSHSAFTGRDALQQVEKSHPDIILLDLMLPDLNGYEICKILKGAKQTSMIPLVIITARIAAENRVESFCLGADDYIAKPYTPDQIFQALDRAMRWVEQSRTSPVEGLIAFDHSDDADTLRRLGQLRSLVYARSELSFDVVQQLGRAIKEIWCLADEWARCHYGVMTPTLVYSLSPERLLLTFQGAAGWLSRVPELADDPASSLRAAGFEEIRSDESDHSLTLIKELPPG